MYKTQVFLNHEGDLFRTRLTHSIEVSQIGRTIARALQLNEDLVEAISLAHDLGHTPFGHAGQDALNTCMAGHGGFEHNLQSLRVVDALEQRYPNFDGLNLCFETREGILKHCSRRNALRLEASEPGGVARRFIDHTRPSLEAQVGNLADEIAYSAHDIDDGVRSGLISIHDLAEVHLFDGCMRAAIEDFPALGHRIQCRRLMYETLRRLIGRLVHDVIDQTRANLGQSRPLDVDAVRQLPEQVSLSPPMRHQLAELKQFLFGALYRHPKVVATTRSAQQVVTDLFSIFCLQPNLLPDDWNRTIDMHRDVADYVAGMTDRFALGEHERLTGLKLLH